MTNAAGQLLVNEIAPIIQATVPRVVKLAASEDAAEVVQSTLAMAANMVESVERAGKKPIARMIAFYAIQRAKSGRRFGYGGNCDTMSPAAMLQSGVTMEYMDAPVTDDDEGTCLHDVLVDSSGEDTAQAAARNLDWAELALDMNSRDLAILEMAGGAVSNKQLSRKLGLSPARITQLKRELGRQIKYRWGEAALADSMILPRWRVGMRCLRERAACRWERRV